MRDASKHRDEIVAAIRERGCVLLLDFDGTLSPIVARHDAARISPRAKAALVRLARRSPVAIISGRSLADVRGRVGVRTDAYAGCHGLELEVRGRRVRQPRPVRALAAFESGKRALRAVAARYGGVSIEDKRYSFALHYRRLAPKARRVLRREAHEAIAPVARAGRVRVFDDPGTFDVIPDAGHKGRTARTLFRLLSEGRGRPVPVYIGDGTTDEDAFRALRRGVTIRVGARRPKSAARYFFHKRLEVDAFLEALAALP